MDSTINVRGYSITKKVEIVEETIQDDLKRLKDLLVAVDHSFTLWNHLQTPSRINYY
jgi:hypothetical protein